MKNLCPRTAQEFAEDGRHLVCCCGACGKDRAVPAGELLAVGGPELDICTALLELIERLRCPACGALVEELFVHKERQTHFEPMTFAEALAADLELRAFARARDRAKALREGCS